MNKNIAAKVGAKRPGLHSDAEASEREHLAYCFLCSYPLNLTAMPLAPFKGGIAVIYNVAFVLFIAILSFNSVANAQQTWNSGKFIIARVKYNGGGDWYNDPSILPNMLNFLSQNTEIECGAEERYVELTDDALFNYPVIFITGHGQIAFSEEETKRLRLYLESGGFLYADDDYGMDKYFRREMKKVFPNKKWVELPFSHEIYHLFYNFPQGIPKIHEHDGGPGKAYGLFHEGKMIAFYTANTNISDGWADPDVHKDPEPVRQTAFRMGANIVVYALIR